ncbi:MAG: hypothetical protein ACFUZC_17905 [Chthoniobacteraceae bacterium]
MKLDLTYIGLLLSILGGGGIVGLLGKIGYLGKARHWLANLLEPHIPSKTVILQPTTVPCWWHMGHVAGQEEQKVMQIVGEFSVTNISKHDIHITGAKLKKRYALKNRYIIGNMSVTAQNSEYSSPECIVPVGCVSTLHFWFWLHPPAQDIGVPFKADVAIIDQFGNQHWFKKLEFVYS